MGIALAINFDGLEAVARGGDGAVTDYDGISNCGERAPKSDVPSRFVVGSVPATNIASELYHRLRDSKGFEGGKDLIGSIAFGEAAEIKAEVRVEFGEGLKAFIQSHFFVASRHEGFGLLFGAGKGSALSSLAPELG